MKLNSKQVQLIASGDLRLSANQKCWPAQQEMEAKLEAAISKAGFELVRAHPFREDVQHGFIASQREGLDVFKNIDPTAPLIIAEAVWQYSHHVLAGLTTHSGPILTLANWSGAWPGLVGMLNLNGSLTKAGGKYATILSEDFTDDYFKAYLHHWLHKGRAKHKTPHVVKFKNVKVRSPERKLGESLAK